MDVKLVLGVIGWAAALIVPAILYTMFWYGMGVGDGHCDALRVLELKELLTSQERFLMDVYYDCNLEDSGSALR